MAIGALGILKELQATIRPVYVLVGSDAFLQRHVLDAFASVIDPGLRQFNVSRFSDEETVAGLDAARTLPMMAPRRLVILDGVDRLKDAEWIAVREYCHAPHDRSILLLLAPKLHAARLKSLAGSVAVISADEPTAQEARANVERSFRTDGYALEKGVIEELLDYVGTGMTDLVQEVEKLKLFALDEKSVRLKDVAALANRVRVREVWDLIDRMATRDRAKLLRVLHRMLEVGTPPLVILKSVYSHFAGLLAVKELEGQGLDRIVEQTGGSSYYLGRLIDQARKFRTLELRRALRELHNADSALKGKQSQWPENVVLELVLLKIVPEKQPRT